MTTETPDLPATASENEPELQARRSRAIGESRPMTERGSLEVEIGPEVRDGRPTAGGWRWIGRKLREPMTSYRAPGRGGEYDYITARQVQTRLDDIVGPGNWETAATIVRADHPVCVLVGLAIYGVWKHDMGYSNNPDQVDELIVVTDPNGKPVVDTTTGEVKTRRNPNYENEPLKAALSDGFKRAAVQWGVGRFLYKESRPQFSKT